MEKKNTYKGVLSRWLRNHRWAGVDVMKINLCLGECFLCKGEYMGRMCGFHEAFSYSCVFSGLTKGVRVEINVKLTEPVVYIWGERRGGGAGALGNWTGPNRCVCVNAHVHMRALWRGCTPILVGQL